MKQGLTNNYSYSTSNSVGQLTVADHQQQLNINNHSLTTAITSPNFNSLSSQASLKPDSTNNITTTTTLKLQNSQSCQDFYLKHNIHNSNSDNIMNIGFHFHLAGFINAENGKFEETFFFSFNLNLSNIDFSLIHPPLKANSLFYKHIVFIVATPDIDFFKVENPYLKGNCKKVWCRVLIALNCKHRLQ